MFAFLSFPLPSNIHLQALASLSQLWPCFSCCSDTEEGKTNRDDCKVWKGPQVTAAYGECASAAFMPHHRLTGLENIRDNPHGLLSVLLPGFPKVRTWPSLVPLISLYSCRLYLRPPHSSVFQKLILMRKGKTFLTPALDLAPMETEVFLSFQ